MNTQPRDYKVAPDGETARLLREAAALAEPIRVDIDVRLVHDGLLLISFKSDAERAKPSGHPHLV